MKKIDTICLVDDDNFFLFLTQKVIEGANLVNQVKLFPNGHEAIEFLKSAQVNKEELPEVILLDLNMPVLDGWGFLEEYLLIQPDLGKKITIYIVSSSIDPADFERARSISAVTDFIVKPVSKEKLLEVLRNM